MTNKQEEAICPICGRDDLEYFGFENKGPQVFYLWKCNHCHSEGNEWFSLHFIKHEVTFNGEH